MQSALAAVNILLASDLEIALKAYRHGYHGKEGSMRKALQAVIDNDRGNGR